MTLLQWLFLIVLALLFYSYVLYPLLAAIIGVGPVASVQDELPAVSILVPAHNEAPVIAAKIANFQALDYPSDHIELVIADDGSTDATAEIVARYSSDGVRFLPSAHRQGKASAMNRLAAAATHPLLLFTDANVIFSRGAVRRLVDRLSDEHVGAVTGEVRLIGSDQEFSSGESLYYWLERQIQGAESRMGSVMGVDGGMYVIRRELFQPLPADTILDDFAVSMHVMRTGKRVVYETAAKATESGTPSARQEFARRSRIAAGAVQLLKRGHVPRLTQVALWFQFVSHKLLRWLSPILLMVLFVANVLLLPQSPWYVVALAGQLALCLMILLTWWFPRLRTTRWGGVLFYFGISQAAMATGLFRGLLNRQPATWNKAGRSDEFAKSAVDS